MMPELSASFANSSGAKGSAPFSVVSGGGKTMTLLIVAAALVFIVGLVVWLKK
jgi:hypothetical protein